MYKILYRLLLPSLVLLFFINGCGNNSVEENNTTKIEVDYKNFKIESIEIGLIGNAQMKYLVEYIEGQSNESGDYTNFYNILDGSTQAGSATANLGNRDNPITLTSGEFYNFIINLNMDKVYPNGLNFNLTLASDGNYSEIIGNGQTGESNETGEGSLYLQALIPADIKEGQYIIAINLTDTDLEKIVSEDKNISEIPEIGAVYVNIEENDNSKRVEIVGFEPNNKYVDLPYKSKFENGYTNTGIGSTYMTFFNSSLEENITISAKLELENGTTLELGILDTADGVVKDKVSATVPTYDGQDMDGLFSLEYYILESDYASLIEILPDLSTTTESNGVKGEVKWDIRRSDQEAIATEYAKNDIVMTKYQKDFSYTDNYVNSSKKLSKELSATPLFITSKIKYNSYNNIVEDWSNFKKDDADFSMGISAAFRVNYYNDNYSDDYAVIITNDKKWHWYNIKTGDTSPADDYLNERASTVSQGIGNCDAAFYTGSLAYFIEGNRYIRLNWKSNTLYEFTKYTFDGNKFDKIDSAYSDGSYGYLIKGDQYYTFSIMYENIEGPYSLKRKFSTLNKNPIAAFKTFRGTEFFAQSPLEEYLNIRNGILFNYNNKVDKKYGNREKISLEFYADYKLKGLWKVPGIEASASANIKTFVLNEYILKKGFTILGVEAEVAAAGTKKHPSATEVQQSRIGGSMDVIVLDSSYFSESNFETEDIEETMDKDATKEEKEEDLKDGEEKNKDKGFEMPKKTWEEERTVATTFFPLGPLPFTVEVGIIGELTVELAFEFDGIGVALVLMTPVELSTFLKGGTTIGLAEAGIKGTVRLINVEPKASLGAKLGMNENNLAFNIHPKVTIDLNILNGELGIYAKSKTKLAFEGWKPILKWHEWYYKLYESDWAYSKKWPIYDENITAVELPLTDLISN